MVNGPKGWLFRQYYPLGNILLWAFLKRRKKNKHFFHVFTWSSFLRIRFMISIYRFNHAVKSSFFVFILVYVFNEGSFLL